MTIKLKQVVNNHHIALLSEAIDDAEAWVGGTDPDSWDEFNVHIAKMRAALEAVRKDRKTLKLAIKTLIEFRAMKND